MTPRAGRPPAPGAVATVVLAAGAGRRLGGPKALARWRGRTFLDHVLGTALGRDPAAPVLVVTGAAALAVRRIAERCGAAAVHNPGWATGGMLSSLLAGLDALPGVGAALVWPVDHPAVRPDTPARLVEAWRRTRAPVVAPRFRGRGGHPVLFGARVFPALRAAPADEGARAVVRALGARALRIEVDDPGVALDVDTPEALETLRALQVTDGPVYSRPP